MASRNTICFGAGLLLVEILSVHCKDTPTPSRRLAQGEELCRDSPPGWVDSSYHSCEKYWGNAERCSIAATLAVDGIDASQACCGCGGGSCVDELGWHDADGRDCDHYRSEGWCADEGYGPNWDLAAWGSMCTASVADGMLAASEACCGCGRGRLYGSSVDILFGEPRCFNASISLDDAGILSSFRGCRVSEPDYSGYYFYDNQGYGGHGGYGGHPCPDNYFMHFYSCGPDGPDPHWCTCPRGSSSSSTSTSSRSTLASTSSTSTTSTSPRMEPDRVFLHWLSAHGSAVDVVDLSHGTNAVCEGGVPSAFRRFSNLRSLNLSNCQLQGSFPASLGSLPLQELDLSHNSFGLQNHTDPHKSGSALPQSWAGLTSLRTLDLSNNMPGICTGPPGYPRPEARASHCRVEDRSMCRQCSPTTPSLEYIAASPSLEVLRLTGFLGQFPSEWQNLLRLQTLDLASPGMYESVRRDGWGFQQYAPLLLPTWLQGMDLEEIRLSGFSISYDYRAGISNALEPLCLTNVRKLELRKVGLNNFYFPYCFGDLPLEELVFIDVGWNMHICQWMRPETGCYPPIGLPEFLGHLTNLKRLHLRDSDFAEQWPSWVGNLQRLEDLDFSLTKPFREVGGKLVYDDNVDGSWRVLRFRGQLPDSFKQLAGTLRSLRMDRNVVKSSLPSWLQDFAHLTTLSAAECALSGELPALPTSLEDLDLSGNDLHGSFQILDYPKLRRLRLGRNTGLRIGSLPDSMDILSDLEVLDLRGTQMSGSLPATLFKLDRMTELSLRSCAVSGTIPAEVGSLSKLRVLDLWGTSLEGGVPAEVIRLVELQVLSLSVDGSSEHSFQLDALAKLSDLTSCTLDEASWLRGTIPASLGMLSKMTRLTITGSSLRGSLPGGVGNMRSLTHLVLADNGLEGTLPAEIASISSLVELVVRRNSLTGTLPAELGYLLNTFSPFEALDLSENRFNHTFAGAFLPPLGPSGYRGYEIVEKTIMLSHNPGLAGSISLERHPNLHTIAAKNCSFHSVTGIGAGVKQVDFTMNALRSFPKFVSTAPLSHYDSWRSLTIETLLLRGNRISSWSLTGTPPVGVFEGDEAPGEHTVIDEGDESPCFGRLQELDVSDNPLGMDVQSFMHSLKPASCRQRNLFGGEAGSSLFRLVAGNASLNGTLYTLRDFIDTDDGVETSQMFPALAHMDLSHNMISEVRMRPEYYDRLLSAQFAFNNLTYLERGWLGEDWDAVTGRVSPVRNLNIRGNPNLKFSVLPTVDNCALHAVPGAPLAGNPVAYTSYIPGRVKCTEPCAAFGNVLLADGVVPDITSLCQCQQGNGIPPDECFDEHWRDPNSSMSCQDIVDGQLCDSLPGARSCCGCGGVGAGANGLHCIRCPEGTFSFSEEEDRFRLRSDCKPCPQGSDTDATGTGSLCGCKCAAGMYLADGGLCAQGASPAYANGTCQHCRYLRTTSRSGALSEAECKCDTAGFRDLLDGGDECGCDQNHHLNHVTKACEPCADDGEDCAWVAPRKALTDSTLPPDLLPGYWAATGYLAGVSDEAGLKSFTQHSIYKCTSAATCRDYQGNCADGREGVACSLCKPGYTGDPDGPCRECKGSAAAALVLVLAAGPLVVLAAHTMLAGESSTRGLIFALRSFRVSARQLIKHIQVVGVVSGFTIEWPDDVKQVFDTITIFNFNLIDAAGLGCLGRQQTASLEFALRYLIPCAFVPLGIFVTPLLAAPLSMLLKCTPMERARRMGEGLSMSLSAAVRAVYWIVVLFFPTFLQNGLRLFTCNVHPNGEISVATHPHLHCLGSKSGADDEWLQLLPAGIAYTAVCLLCCVGAYVFFYRRTWQTMEASDFESRGEYEFLFEDFRDSAVHWPVLLLCRDAYINAVGAVLNNYGTSQLLLVAAGMLLLGYLSIAQNPYMDASNTMVEVVNAVFLFAISMFTAGMGFTQAPGLEDMATLAKQTSNARGEDVMNTRARILLGLQLASLIGPFIVLAYQLLLLVPIVERNLPACIRPLQESDDAALRAYLREALHIAEGDRVNARNVDKILSRLDTHELQQLVNVMIASPAASKGILREAGTSTSFQKVLKRANSSSSQFSRVTSPTSAGSTSVVPMISDTSLGKKPADVEHGGGAETEELVQLLQKKKEEQADKFNSKIALQAAEIQKLLQLARRHSIQVEQHDVDDLATPRPAEETSSIEVIVTSPPQASASRLQDVDSEIITL